MGFFGLFENDDNTKRIMKDDDATTKETRYLDGSSRFVQIREYSDDRHDTRFATYDNDSGRYVEGYHGENNDADYKTALRDAAEEMRGRR